ncbi:hypothetical protein AAI421_17995 [Rhodococcus aetherivorans]|uniref:hypothetical protein n=1 Tax=Rhodococcus aetherivorans TaxID=191292 RepID=UPI0031D253F3
MNEIATRTVTLSERKVNEEGGRAYLASFVGKRAVHTDWKGTKRVGTLELDTRKGWVDRYLLVRFDDGMFARCDSKIELVVEDEIDTSNAAIVAEIKREILADIAEGTVPADVASFSELHDYVDANGYADELVSKREESETWVDFVNAITDEIDAWIRSGMPR